MKKLLCAFMACISILYAFSLDISATEAPTNYAEQGRSEYEKEKALDTAIKLATPPNCENTTNTIFVTMEMITQSGIALTFVDTYTYNGVEYSVYTANISNFEPEYPKYVFFDDNCLVIDDKTISELAKFVYTLEWKNMSTGSMVDNAIPAMSKDERRWNLVEALNKVSNLLSSGAGTLTALAITSGGSAVPTATLSKSIVETTVSWGVDECVDVISDLNGAVIKAVTLLYFNEVDELSRLNNDFIALAGNQSYLQTEDGVEEFFKKANDLYLHYDTVSLMIDYVAEVNELDVGEVLTNLCDKYIEGFAGGLVGTLADDVFKNKKNLKHIKEVYGSTKMANAVIAEKYIFDGMPLLQLLAIEGIDWGTVSPALAAAEIAMHTSANSAYNAIEALCEYTRNYIYNTV